MSPTPPSGRAAALIAALGLSLTGLGCASKSPEPDPLPDARDPVLRDTTPVDTQEGQESPPARAEDPEPGETSAEAQEPDSEQPSQAPESDSPADRTDTDKDPAPKTRPRPPINPPPASAYGGPPIDRLEPSPAPRKR